MSVRMPSLSHSVCIPGAVEITVISACLAFAAGIADIWSLFVSLAGDALVLVTELMASLGAGIAEHRTGFVSAEVTLHAAGYNLAVISIRVVPCNERSVYLDFMRYR